MARAAKKETPLTTEEKLAKALVPEEEQPYPVPENWCWVRLGDVIELISGRDVPLSRCNNENIGIPYILGASNLENNVFSAERWIEKPEVVSQRGDILLSVKGTIGKVYIQREEYINISRQIMSIRPSCLLTEKFTYNFLVSICDELKLIGNGLIPGISRNDILNYTIPLPPLPEQQRIVTLIESLFADLDAAKEKLQAVLDGFAERRAALLHQAFTGELTREWREEQGVGLESWDNVCIEDVANVKGGKRVPKGMSLVSENTGHPYIKAGNLKNGTVVPDNMMYVPADVLQHIKQYTVNSGDVYITNVGACIGDCGIIPPEFNGANLTENAVKLTELRCDSLFLARYLSSKKIQADIKNRIASATLGKLSIANIKKIPVNLPPFSEQKEIVRILDDIFAKESQSKAAVESALAKIDTIKKAILATAFRGGFETSDSSDENAEKLLRRVL